MKGSVRFQERETPKALWENYWNPEREKGEEEGKRNAVHMAENETE